MKALIRILLPIILGLAALNARALDVADYGIVKQMQFTQTSTATPVANSTGGFSFQVFIELCSVVGVTNGTLQLPNSTVTNLPVSQDFSQNFVGYDANFDTKTAMDGAYPNSANYTMTIGAVSDGTKVINLPLSADNYPVTVPHISNFTAAQAINSEADFTLTWDALSGGTTNDFIQVEITDQNDNTIFSTSTPGGPNPLRGTSNSVVIPASSLMSGVTYKGTLVFAKGIQTNTYAGVVGIAGYSKQTSFTVKTVDTANYLALKGQAFSQTSTAAPASQGFAFLLNVNTFYNTNSVTNASVTGPFPGGFVNLPGTNDFSFQTNYSTQTPMDAFFTNGTYTFTIKSIHDGTITAAVSLTGNNYPATTPRISNFTAAQTINPKGDFTLTWDAFSGGTASDFISVEVKDNNGDTYFRTRDFGEVGSLNGTATSVVIPGHTLQAGTSYTVGLIYGRGTTNNNLYPGVAGAGAYFKKTSCPIRTTDVSTYGVIKGQAFAQNSTSAGTFTNAYFSAFLDTGGSLVNSATVTLPNSSVQTLPATNDFSIEATFATTNAMNSAYPSGNPYTFAINTVDDGSKSVGFNLSTESYPNTPHISNFTAAQAIHCCTNFTLTWDALGGSASDYVQLQVMDPGFQDPVFRSPQFQTAGQLTGTSNSIVIPAETLRPGRTYSVKMEFIKLSLNTSGYTGASGVSGFAKSLTFPLVTSGTTVRPQILQASYNSGGQNFQFQVFGEDSRSIIIEYATDLLSTNTVWTGIQTNSIFGGNIQINDNTGGGVKRFYRAREGY